ncbi:MAG: HAD-IIIA family hydrolase [Candidatus Zixiibacteriota bacterium]
MQSRILVIRLSSLGDILLTSPVILNLKIHYKNSHITFLTKERFANLVSSFDGVDEVVALPDNNGIADYFAILTELSSRRFDFIVDLHGKPFTWLVRNWVYSSERWAVPKRRIERWLATKGVMGSSAPHTIDLHNSFFTDRGLHDHARRPILGDFGCARHLPRQNYVCLCPGAAHATKKWPRSRFVRLAEMIHTSTGLDVAWIEEKETDANDIRGKKYGWLSVIAGKTLNEVAATIARAKAVISNDSGLMHLSSALNTPVIAIFGPTHPALGFSPRGFHDQIVEVDEPCRPCSIHGKNLCYRDKQYCLERIDGEEVLDRLQNLLSSSANTHRAIFLDRDGTVIVEKQFLRDPMGVELEKGAASALKKLKGMDYKLITVSNQSGVARGLLTEDDVRAVNARMVWLLEREGVTLDDMLWCPYFEHGIVENYAKPSRLRKPSPGMPEDAAERHGIDLRRSWVIGDRLDDTNLARVINARPILLKTGYGAETASLWSTTLERAGIPVVDGLSAAADLIARQSG